MTPNQRIALNVVSTYGRSVYALACGLFASRWVLMALGKSDFGLYSVVGGLIFFVSFINGVLGQAVARFYAYNVGVIQSNPHHGLEECRRWFSTAFFLHTTIPVVLVAIGYPVGVWLVNHYLSIPVNRLCPCLWVWRFACISSFFSMVNVPFQAMFTAKQEISELTFYSLFSSTASLVSVYYMMTHPGDWLAGYAGISCAVVVLPQIVVGVRAFFKYPECRIMMGSLLDVDRIMKLMAFAGSRFVCAFSQVLSTSGLSVLINTELGAVRNSAMTVGNGLISHCNTLTGAIVGSFTPAITNAAGEGDFCKMREYVYSTCSFCAFAAYFFMVPLAVEIDEVMHLWLNDPPAYSASVALCILISFCIEHVAEGMGLGVSALGRIAEFQSVEAVMWLFVLPLSYFGVMLGLDLVGVGIALIFVRLAVVLVRLVYERRYCGISIREWMGRAVVPSIVAVGCALPMAVCVRVFLPGGPARIMLTILAYESVFLPISWAFLVPPSVKFRVIRCMRKAFGR